MKKHLTLLLLCMMSATLSAQTTLKLQTMGGYEWNVFQSPTSYTNSEGVTMNRDQLWVSAPFTSVGLSAGWKRDLGKGKLKLNGGFSKALYFSSTSADQLKYDFGASYRIKYAKKKFFEFAPEFARVERQGTDQSDNILRTPFSYKHAIAPLHFDFYLGDKKWLKTKVAYHYKFYDRTDGGQLFYHGIEPSIKWSKKYDNTKDVQKISIEGSAMFRKYTDVRVSSTTAASTEASEVDVEADEEDLEEEELGEEEESGEDTEANEGSADVRERKWNYYNLTWTHQYESKDEKLSTSISLNNRFRQDVLGSQTYNQTMFTAGLTRRFGKTKVSVTGGYAFRYFTAVKVSSSQTPLSYHYLRGKLAVVYPINDHWDLKLKASLVKRISNNKSVTSRSYRGYFNGYVGLGIAYKF